MPRASTNAARQAANLSIDANLMKEAKGLDVNMSRAAEAGIAEAVAAEKARLWKIENRAAIESWNAYVEEHGLPLAEFRQF
ncbi:type II toxin-antitoxin system CcdA family antitoxin [Mesorhizobium sp. 8]|jgi:antitoxin CcdA|uniref:type II toxin-antitoxin system CcdA family antitoxin n=1 Tax=Mesorhizobium sp. 8 TaxID=2584466 RepID=UPI0011222519|nr:type II toxin-antitoxin system CcdA family antitoxin [Mesorhizobium sp. 8]QDC01105.1 post-segregation antitoxin CcdA [Mesorhizobium sp. 8]